MHGMYIASEFGVCLMLLLYIFVCFGLNRAVGAILSNEISKRYGTIYANVYIFIYLFVYLYIYIYTYIHIHIYNMYIYTHIYIVLVFHYLCAMPMYVFYIG